MSSASLPRLSPGGGAAPAPAPRPQVVHPAPRKPRKLGLGLTAVIVAALIGGAAWYLRNQKEKGPSQSEVVTRTAAVGFGRLDRTIRVSGTIAAESFAAVMAPQLRGSRSDRRRGGSSGGGGGGSSSSGGSSGGSGSSSSSSSGSSSSSSSTSGSS